MDATPSPQGAAAQTDAGAEAGPSNATGGRGQTEGLAGPVKLGGAKISCLACRAAKRKCHTPDVHTTCRRCVTHELVCEYQKHRRGRRKKDATVPVSDDASPSLPALLPPQPPVYPPPPVPPARQAQTSGSARGTSQSHASQSPAASGAMSIQFSHVVREGDSSPFIAGPSRAQPPPSGSGSFGLLRRDYPDPLQAGVLNELDVFELFNYYFENLNLVVAILDPRLHTPSYCQQKSALLFSAVLCVTAKIFRPDAYSACLAIANKLIGQAVEYGLCSVEVVQAINLLTHWKKADDATSWRKVGYAIRMAYELRLNVNARPLPTDELQAREVLNRERTWLNLVIADYHLAIHHSLPRMISEEDIDDPAQWLAEHPHLPTPGESSIPPGSSMIGIAGEPNFLQPQVSTIRLCDALFAFHLAEYRLLYNYRYRAKDQAVNVDVPSDFTIAFCGCVDAAVGLAVVFQDHFVRPGYLPFCFNLAYVALAICSIWLVKNISTMSQSDRERVVRTLSDIQAAVEAASRSSDDMPAYMHRLLTHLLSTLSPATQLSSLATSQTASTSQIIQDNLHPHHPHPAPPPLQQDQQPFVSTSTATLPQQEQTDANVFAGLDALPMHEDMLFPAADDDIWRLLFPVTGDTVMQ
ncbi:Zn(2)-C6 fungal-type transcription factor [Rhodotorula toruloides]|uniref:Zn(2)-C6 fungal-type transcription factor n=1 Tax=Rhodotorula toruloides TaxID=5286 RepID=A0A511K7D0_RHOTO|nr:Zn(2)-C6 fungal-type transcription factor [Rhodotorula toruloides]